MARYEINNLVEPIDFECDGDEVKRILQNAKNLLMCRKGEVPYDRQRGFDVSLFDLPMAQLEGLLVPELDRVMLWEPHVEVVSGRVRLDEDGRHVVTCVVDVEVEG